MTIVINIIGAGNLGRTIGHLIAKKTTFKIGSVYNRTQASAKKAIEFIGQGELCKALNELESADITFITTPDDCIAQVCEELSLQSRLKPGSIVVHCSGALDSDILIPAKNKGCYVASVHPMRSFAKPDLSVKEYEGTYCATEGDKEAISCIQELFNLIGSKTYIINKDKKTLYHVAGVFASNYVVTLAKIAELCLEEAGVDEDIAIGVISNLMQGTALNLENTLSPEKSLTGPIQRGDKQTIENHMKAFSNMESKQIYAMLGKATVKLTALNQREQEAIDKIFAHVY